MSSSVCSGSSGASRQSVSLTTPEYGRLGLSILIGMVITLPEAVWRECAAAHEARVRPWVDSRLVRRAAGQSDPVDDFLFTYLLVPSPPAPHLAPRAQHGLCGTYSARAPVQARAHKDRRRRNGRSEPFVNRLPSARWIDRLLRATLDRAPVFGCFRMHEWAMVYRTEPADVRHSPWPLRLSPAEIATAVEDVGARCTHFDAFRFFTEATRPHNTQQLTRADQLSAEQADAFMQAWTSTGGSTK